MTMLDAKRTESGALTQRWRIKSLQHHNRKRKGATPNDDYPELTWDHSLSVPSSVSPSTQDSLARLLVASFAIESIGYNLTSYGPYMKELPKRLGHSVALDAAVACLTDAHSKILRRAPVNTVINPYLYLAAVQGLQMALEDSTESASADTLCATALLAVAEVRTERCRRSSWPRSADETSGLQSRRLQIPPSCRWRRSLSPAPWRVQTCHRIRESDSPRPSRRDRKSHSFKRLPASYHLDSHLLDRPLPLPEHRLLPLSP